jgi:two-component system, NarL family, response regulator DevR
MRVERRLSVFLVEDSAVVLNSLMLLLSGHPEFRVVGSAAGVAEACEGIQNSCPDVVVLDLRLGKDQGLDVLRWTQENRAPCPETIVLTTEGSDEVRRHCLEAGAGFFFDKSTEFHRLVPALRFLAARSREPF